MTARPQSLRREPLRYRMRAFFGKPANIMLLLFLIVLVVLSLMPMITMLENMFVVHPGQETRLTRMRAGQTTVFHFKKLFAGDEWSRVNFWTPFFNSLIVACGSGLLGILVGGTVAWFITQFIFRFLRRRADVPIFGLILDFDIQEVLPFRLPALPFGKSEKKAAPAKPARRVQEAPADEDVKTYPARRQATPAAKAETPAAKPVRTRAAGAHDVQPARSAGRHAAPDTSAAKKTVRPRGAGYQGKH